MSDNGPYEQISITMSASGFYDPNGAEEAWRVQLQLKHSSLKDSAVLWAQFSQDPIQQFKVNLKKNREFLSEALAHVEDDEKRLEKRSMMVSALWDGLFRQITGEQVQQLAPGHENVSALISNESRDTVWIATKVAESSRAAGSPICWASSIEPQFGSTIQLSLTPQNVVDLIQIYREIVGDD